MYKVILAGGIASGKSTAAAELERLGARRIDLDQVSRDVLAPGTACTAEVAAAFGADLLDEKSGRLDRALLASRAFASAEATARLEAIELPHITRELESRLAAAEADDVACALVEVPLLDRLGDAHALADEVLVVTCPTDVRRERARDRGMAPADFDQRLAHQPSDDYLRAHADAEIANDGDLAHLLDQVRAWWADRTAKQLIKGDPHGQR